MHSLTSGGAAFLAPRALVVAALLLTAGGASRADDSLATAAPADVGLFVELRDASDLLLPLLEPQAWLTVAQFAGQPAALTETEQWRQRVEQTVNMSPADAIRTLFAERVAFVADDLRRMQDAAILCRPAGAPQPLIARWQTRPLPSSGRTSVYRLPHEIGLAVHRDVLVFGEPAPHGMFDRVVQQLDAQPQAALAGDPVYQHLLARVPPNPDGIFFARLRRKSPATAPASAPSTSRPARNPFSDWPLPLGGSSNVLLALHRQDAVLHFSVVGDAAGHSATPPASPQELVATLPERTLLAWGGSVDYAALQQAVAALPDQNLLRLLTRVHQRPGTLQRLVAALEPTVAVAIGTVTPESRELAAPPIPSAALLLKARDPLAAAEQWANLFHSSLALYKLLLLKLAAPPLVPPVEEVTLAGVPAELLDLSELVSDEPEQTPLGELHLAWALDHDVLIIASHADWLQQILAARHGQAARLALDLGRPAANQAAAAAVPRPTSLFVAQAGPLADLGRVWLQYLEQAVPAVLNERWWRHYQPGGENVQIGARVLIDRERQRLVVQTVTAGLPAEGVLKPSDEILGCNQRRFTTTEPLEELLRGLADRPNARWLDMLVERDRVVRVKRVALPFVDPVEVLRRVIAIGQVVQRVVYAEDVPDPAGTRGFLTVELRGGRPPLFPFAITPPATAPVSLSATVPAAPASMSAATPPEK
jgi:hypothetical protein